MGLASVRSGPDMATDTAGCLSCLSDHQVTKHQQRSDSRLKFESNPIFLNRWIGLESLQLIWLFEVLNYEEAFYH